MEKITRNYAAQAESGLSYYQKAIQAHLRDQSLSEYDRQAAKDDLRSLVRLQYLISKSAHFALPEGGVIFEDGFKGIRGASIRLPFKNITVEYHIPDGFNGEDNPINKNLIVAEEVTAEELIERGVNVNERRKYDDNHIFIVLYFIFLNDIRGNAHSFWQPSMFSVHIDSNWDTVYPDDSEQHKKEAEANKKTDGLYWSGHIFLEFIRRLTDDEKKVEYTREAMYHQAMYPLLEFIEALSCRNVKATVAQEASPKNAKRIKQGKLPIYETKILTIDCPGSPESGEKGEPSGIRSGVRQHLWRGHIRRLPAGNIWVNACVVGSVENGIINKSYNLKKTA